MSDPWIYPEHRKVQYVFCIGLMYLLSVNNFILIILYGIFVHKIDVLDSLYSVYDRPTLVFENHIILKFTSLNAKIGVKWLSKGSPASMTLMRSHHDSHEESHWLLWGVMLTLYTESDHSYDFFSQISRVCCYASGHYAIVESGMPYCFQCRLRMSISWLSHIEVGWNLYQIIIWVIGTL